MLYDHWRNVVRDHGRNVAVRDFSTGHSWTFNSLARESEQLPASAGSIVYPRGHAVGFILDVLRGWRDGRPVCPLDAGQAAPIESAAGLPGKVAHIKSTSATAGRQRLVVFTEEQLMADARNIIATMGLNPNSPNIGVISLAHSYGFSNLITPLLLHGVPLMLPGSPLPEVMREALRVSANVTLPAVPAMWRAWQDAGIPMANVALGISAAAPLPLSLETEIFHKAGLKIHNFYGATECGGIAYDRTTVPRSDSSLIGSALEGVDLQLAPDGCIVVRSDAVGEGYWPEEEAELGGGAFQTSDLADITTLGVFLRGRRTDQINVAGRKLSPEIVEQALRSHPAVLDCVTFGVPSDDPERAEEIVASVLNSAVVTSGELKQFLLKRLESWQIPRLWWFPGRLEANSRGKISRSALRKEYLAMRQANPE